ncbi:HD-GYP domain-containing protein [Ammonifex thiophilus]|uniref:HD-GYP domain-containing protein n=1 Tax=Ammonifex thiophilus TaxID=444093 RepID=A0A3D8P199_9THEO|nr:HD-GYP domain-containing protein [Ammonifex thiophilus]RDV81187.1 HD-GYP domain-containing protein [Ammonifex thiophilus]
MAASLEERLAGAFLDLLCRRDPLTAAHCREVGELCAALAAQFGFPPGKARLAGYLHDLGKLGVPAELLLRPGKLEPVEFALVKAHPVVGAEILSAAGVDGEIVDAVKHHHENHDGTGYPDGLGGGEIPFLARIVRVADAFDAMTSPRPYRGAFSAEEALEEIRKGAGRQFDPEVVSAFLMLRGVVGLA